MVFKNKYIVKDTGLIYEKETQKLIKTYNRGNGYLGIRLDGVRYYVHRLMAFVFIENKYNKPCVNHINGIKTDNRVENLEWCTHSENMIHLFKLKGTSHLNSEKSIASKNKKIYSELDNIFFESLHSASNYYRMHKSTLSNQIKGKRQNKYLLKYI